MNKIKKQFKKFIFILKCIFNKIIGNIIYAIESEKEINLKIFASNDSDAKTKALNILNEHEKIQSLSTKYYLKQKDRIVTEYFMEIEANAW